MSGERGKRLRACPASREVYTLAVLILGALSMGPMPRRALINAPDNETHTVRVSSKIAKEVKPCQGSTERTPSCTIADVSSDVGGKFVVSFIWQSCRKSMHKIWHQARETRRTLSNKKNSNLRNSRMKKKSQTFHNTKPREHFIIQRNLEQWVIFIYTSWNNEWLPSSGQTKFQGYEIRGWKRAASWEKMHRTFQSGCSRFPHDRLRYERLWTRVFSLLVKVYNSTLVSLLHWTTRISETSGIKG